MKNYTESLILALSNEVNSLVTCWQIKLVSGQILGFTDSDRRFSIDGVVYNPEGGFIRSDIDRRLGSEASSIALSSYFSSLLPDTVIASGQLSNAQVFAFRVDPYNLPTTLSDSPYNYDPLVRGRIDKLTLTDQTYQATLEGLKDGLSKKTGWVVQSTCRNDFCDRLCGLSIANYTDNFKVLNPLSPTYFTVNINYVEGLYNGGLITWKTGSNLGLQSVCIYSKESNIRILEWLPNPIGAGDTGTITQACLKTLTDCDRHGNRSHFNGEPNLPGESVINSHAPQTNPA